MTVDVNSSRITRSKSKTYSEAVSSSSNSSQANTVSNKPRKQSSSSSRSRKVKTTLPNSSNSNSEIAPSQSISSVFPSFALDSVIEIHPVTVVTDNDSSDSSDELDSNVSVYSPTAASESESINASDSDSSEIRRTHFRRARISARSNAPRFCSRFFSSLLDRHSLNQLSQQLQDSFGNADLLQSADYRTYLLNDGFDELVARKKLYRKVPFACQDLFIAVARLHLKQVSHAIQSKDKTAIFCSIMGLLLFPSHSLKRCRAGQGRKHRKKVSIINERLEAERKRITSNYPLGNVTMKK